MKIKNSIKVFFILVFIILVSNNTNANAASKLSIEVREDPTYIYKNNSKTVQLKILLDGKATTKANISFESNKEDIATVNKKTGEIKGIKEGTAEITITAKKESLEAKKSFKVHVREPFKNIETLNNAPKMSVTTNQDKFDDVTITISDQNGLDSKNIHFYEGILKNGVNTYDSSKEITNQILVKAPEVTKKDGTKNLEYKCIISKDYLKEQKNKLFIKVKDNTGKYFNTHYIIKKGKNHYTFDAAPSVGYFAANLDKNTVSFVVKDYGGINEIKVYDNYNENKLIASCGKSSSVYTLITLNLSDLTEKNGNYLLRIKTQDGNAVNKNHAFRLIQLSLPKLTMEVSKNSIDMGKDEIAEIKYIVKLGKNTVNNAKVTYKSSDTNIVKVNSAGKIKAINKGNAEIIATATYKNRTATAKIKVNVTDEYKIGNDNNMYYCYNGDVNKKVTGFVTIKGKIYYFSPKEEKYKTEFYKHAININKLANRGISLKVDNNGYITSVNKYEQKIGWVKIENDYYFFNTKYGTEGYMEKGKTIDGIELGSDGKAKLSSSQYTEKYAKLKLQTLERASAVAAAVTTPNMPRKTKLEKCYYYISEMQYDRVGGASSEYLDDLDYGVDFNSGDGRLWDIEEAKNALFCDYNSEFYWADHTNNIEQRCCYCAGAAFAYLANAIGYSGARSEGWNTNEHNHGWMRIKGPEIKEDFGEDDLVFDIVWGDEALNGNFAPRPKTVDCLVHPEYSDISIIPVDDNKPIK